MKKNKITGLIGTAVLHILLLILLLVIAIRRPQVQRQTLIGLGLNKLHRVRTLEDTPAVRGMIRAVQHLVRVVDEK